MPRSLSLLPAALACAVALLAAPAAVGSSPDVVVSQVFAGGGNSGAPYTHDFVELFNRGSTSVDVSGWTVQYATAAGTTWQATTLSGSIAPGSYYLVQLASGGTSGGPLPAADATGTSNMANTGGKVALVRNGTPLSCGASPGSCAGDPHLADLVGYGSATDYEGTAAAALTNTTALLRAAGGCTDTDQNASDLSTSAPSPRTSSATAAPCESEPPDEDSASASASVDVEVEAAITIALERASVSFGRTRVGQTPSPVSQQVTVTSNNQAGYALTVHRTAFQPADLPLGIAGSAAPGGELGPALAGGVRAPIPIIPAPDLLVGSTAAPSAGGGDVWPLNLGFVSPIPSVPAGVYSAVVTFTVIGR